MQVGTKVTYTALGYARDYIYTMTSLSEINNLKKDVYTKRKGEVVKIENTKYGFVSLTIKWEDVAGYWQSDTSFVYEEDIQEVEEEAEEAEEAEEGDNIMTNVKQQYISNGQKFKVGDTIICDYKTLTGKTYQKARVQIEQKRGTIIHIEKSIFYPECDDMAGATIKWDSGKENGFEWLSELKKEQ